MARRAKTGRLNTVESDRLVGLIAVFEQALSLVEDDVSAATKWMCSPVSWTWFEASNRHVLHEGGNERCPRCYRSTGEGSARLNFVTCLSLGAPDVDCCNRSFGQGPA
ncbi:hypothetical protein ACK3BE_09445 [Pseudomonas mandelii]|uniref:hypothetical protein n=1 Tax=Pseudomonas mandelii TaxID=75612 RepID=UPI00398D0C02